MNKDLISSKLKQYNFTIGCYDEKMEQLTKYNINKILNIINNTLDTTDIDLTINRKKYVLELYVVDKEVDFSLLTKDEYISRYGDERWSNE